MAVPGFFPQMVYGNEAVVDLHVYCPTIGAGLPSSISQFTMSVWTCHGAFNLAVNRRVATGTPAYLTVIMESSATSVDVGPQTPHVLLSAVNNAGTPLINSINFVGPGSVQEVPYYDQMAGTTEYVSVTGVHTLLSVNLITHTAQVYCNDAAMVLDSGSWGTSAAVENTALYWQYETSGGASADVWFVPTAIDLSVTANRRQFINADLSAVALPSNGAVTIGGSTVLPAIFLHAVHGGSPAGFYANNGSALAWALDLISVAPSFPPLLDPAATSPCMEVVGTPPTLTSSLAMDNVLALGPVLKDSKQVFLQWSDDRGHRYGSPVGQPLGNRGEYITSVQWQRIGYGRDRVFRIFWSVPVATALQGAWIETDQRAKS